MRVRSLAFAALLLLGATTASFAQDLGYDVRDPNLTPPNPLTVQTLRRFSKELLDSNAVPFMQPLVTSINATSNSRFFNQAFVPSKVDKPYFRAGVHMMVGFIRDDQKQYDPALPSRSSFSIQDIERFYSNGQISDTVGLVNELLKYVLYKGQQQGSVALPNKAATVFGYMPGQSIPFDADTLLAILKREPLYAFLPTNTKNALDSTIGKLPKNATLALPTGQNMTTLIAAVPQFEIGSLYGTEALVRFIPPVKLDKNIGRFAFWGIGLKHSISQYFNKSDSNRLFDAAIQVAYQGTYLEQSVGLTGAKLTADGTIWNVNLQASKHFEGILDVFTGFSFENLRIAATYEYVLPNQLQEQLNIVDRLPQTSKPVFTDTNYKWVIGVARQFGPIAAFVDYNVSKFNILSGGVEYRF